MVEGISSTDKKGISVYVTTDVYESLAELAMKNHRSVSNQVALIIKESIQEQKGQA